MNWRATQSPVTSGEKSLAAAREARDNMWQLNASVLIAQAESESPDLMSDTGQGQRRLHTIKILCIVR